MAEINPELAEVVMEMLGELDVPETVIYADENHKRPVDDRIDAYGAAFQRLYALIAGSPGLTPQVQEAIEKLEAVTAPEPGS